MGFFVVSLTQSNRVLLIGKGTFTSFIFVNNGEKIYRVSENLANLRLQRRGHRGNDNKKKNDGKAPVSL